MCHLGDIYEKVGGSMGRWREVHDSGLLYMRGAFVLSFEGGIGETCSRVIRGL